MTDEGRGKPGEMCFRGRLNISLETPPNFLSNSLKILGTMLAQGADIIRGQLLALVHVAADFADPTLLLGQLGLRLRLDVLEVVSIGHGRRLGQNLRLSDVGHKQSMGSPI